MAKELDAQLFVYDKDSGKFVIDTINKIPGELSQLKNREYNDGYSYENLITTDKGFTSFKSIFSDENLYVHYSTIEDFDWGIMLARYESQVFEKTHIVSKILFVSFAIMVLIISLYILFILNSEKRRSMVTVQASGIRKLLLEINKQHSNVLEALKKVQEFSLSRSSFFVDTDGEDYHYILPSYKEHLLCNVERKYFVSELFHYVANLYNINKSTVGIMNIVPDSHLAKTNITLYDFLNKNNIKETVTK